MMNSSKNEFYFAYGSNMNEKRMLERVGEHISRKLGIIKGYDLNFDKTTEKAKDGSGYANIVQSKNKDKILEGIVYELQMSQIEKLDKYECTPFHYTREKIIIDIIDKQQKTKSQECWVYIAVPEVCKAGLKPRLDYLNHLLAGKDLLSQQYYQELEKWLKNTDDGL